MTTPRIPVIDAELDADGNSVTKDIDSYQRMSQRTVRDGELRARKLSHFAMGLCEESGETAGYIKKHLFYDQPLNRDAIVKELGDVLWYASALATACGITMSEVLATNLDKLRRRYPDKFSVADAFARKDEE